MTAGLNNNAGNDNDAPGRKRTRRGGRKNKAQQAAASHSGQPGIPNNKPPEASDEHVLRLR
jgi:hypothetical protein